MRSWTNIDKQGIIGILVLITIFIVLATSSILLRYCKPQNEPQSNADSVFVVHISELQQEHRQRQYNRPSSHVHNNRRTITPFNYNPNTLDSAGFVKLGLSPYVAKNIMHYRAKGGQFRKPEDFGKIYGIDSADFQILKPYIVIPEQEQHSAQVEQEKKKQREPEKFIVIDLNTADTTTLKQLRGIGSARAKMIVNYGKQLGGFVSANQLREIKNLPPELIDSLMTHFTVSVNQIKPIKVNRANVETLKRHPYLNYYQARAIYDLRVKKIELHSIDDLKSLKEFTESDLERLRPYLDFSKAY